MHQSQFDRVRDPLVEHFTLDELPRIAPWVAEQIDAEGRGRVLAILGAMGEPQAEHSMRSWVTAVHRSAGDLREALQA
jgi:hypothetical protein